MSHYYPNFYSCATNQSLARKDARVSFIIQGEPTSETTYEISVVGFEDLKKSSDFILPVESKEPPLFGNLEGLDKEFFLPCRTSGLTAEKLEENNSLF